MTELKEKDKSRAQKWREDNPEKARRWEAANPESRKAAGRRYYATHRVKCLEKYRVARRKATDRWQAANPEKMRAAHLRRSYGITLPEFLEIQQSQNGLCAICKFKKAEYVDHSHATEKVRGLLCRNCNLGLGYFKDDFYCLIRAASYIRQSER